MRQAIQEPEGRLLYVPVRSAGCGAITVQTGRLASGERIGLAFTSEAALVATLGAGQRWINLAGRLVPGMFAEAGVDETRIDPLPVVAVAAAAAVTPTASVPVPVPVPVPVAAAAPAVGVAAVGAPPAEAARKPRRTRLWASHRPARHHARPTAVRHAY
jgi:hypothetical protein